jgi:hypothetical protein
VSSRGILALARPLAPVRPDGIHCARNFKNGKVYT